MDAAALTIGQSNEFEKVLQYIFYLNPLPNDKILDQSKLKACADDEINLTEELKVMVIKILFTITSASEFYFTIGQSKKFEKVLQYIFPLLFTK